MKKRDYILIEALFEREEDINYKDLGIKTDNSGVALESLPRVIFTKSIISFGPSSYEGVQTLHMTDGGSFLVKADSIGVVLDMIYEDFDEVDPNSDTEEDML